jgi:hypothetical protein
VKHTVRLKGVTVGHSELEHADPGVGRAWGSFRPGMGYELVQPIFQLYAEAVPRDGRARDASKLARYHSARDALGLELVDAAGQPIRTTAIHIADYSNGAGQQTIELDVLISDDGYWARRGA